MPKNSHTATASLRHAKSHQWKIVHSVQHQHFGGRKSRENRKMFQLVVVGKVSNAQTEVKLLNIVELWHFCGQTTKL